MLIYTNQLDTLNVETTMPSQVKIIFPFRKKSKKKKLLFHRLERSAPCTSTPLYSSKSLLSIQADLNSASSDLNWVLKSCFHINANILFQKPNCNLKFYLYILFTMWGQEPDILFITVPSTVRYTEGTQLWTKQYLCKLLGSINIKTNH